MAIPDKFALAPETLESPLSGGFDITPSDSADLEATTRGITAQMGGTLRVTLKSGAIVNTAVATGGMLPVRATRVHASGTTAVGLAGFY